jgi:hypothetical protein
MPLTRSSAQSLSASSKSRIDGTQCGLPSARISILRSSIQSMMAKLIDPAGMVGGMQTTEFEVSEEGREIVLTLSFSVHRGLMPPHPEICFRHELPLARHSRHRVSSLRRRKPLRLCPNPSWSRTSVTRRRVHRRAHYVRCRRLQAFGEGDYREGSQASMWIQRAVKEIGEPHSSGSRQGAKRRPRSPPVHVVEQTPAVLAGTVASASSTGEFTPPKKVPVGAKEGVLRPLTVQRRRDNMQVRPAAR